MSRILWYIGDTTLKGLVLSTALLLTVGTSFGMNEDIFARQHPSEVTEVAQGYHLLATMPETKKAIDGLVRTMDGKQTTLAMAKASLQGMTLEGLDHSMKEKGWMTSDQSASAMTAKPVHGITMDELLIALQEKGKDKATVYDGAQVLSILDTKLTKRLRFFKRIHNWYGDNQLDRSNRQEEAAALAAKEKAEKGSYAWYVLKDLRYDILDNIEKAIQEKGNALMGKDIARAIANAADSNAKHVKSEELRYYMNELVWYAVTETTKELGK